MSQVFRKLHAQATEFAAVDDQAEMDLFMPLASLASFISPSRARSTAVPVSAGSCTSKLAMHAGVSLFAHWEQDCNPFERVVKRFGFCVVAIFVITHRSPSKVAC